MRYDFVEIGTSYFDTLAQDAGNGVGISIEPIVEYLDMLPNRPGLTKVNAAISDKDGSTKIFYVSKEDVEKHDLPEWVCGCNSIESPHPIVEKLLVDKNLQDLMKYREVETLSPATLMKKYDIESVKFLKIDVEGKDGVVMNSWIDACLTHGRSLPEKIVLEDNQDVTNATKDAITRLEKLGYVTKRQGDNVHFRKDKQCLKILFFTHTKWAFGSIHFELCKYLHEKGHIADIIDWTQNYNYNDFNYLSNYYDLIVTNPDGVLSLRTYNIPDNKIVAIAHGEPDYLQTITTIGSNNYNDFFDSLAGFGAVSESLIFSSIHLGIRRLPRLTPVGINYKKYYAEPSKELRRVGYAASFLRHTNTGVDGKRGHLVKELCEENCLAFIPVGSLEYQMMPGYYKSVDAVVMSSLQEGAGLPVMEAAAAGKLVIGTPVGHFPLKAYEGAGILAPLEPKKFKEFTAKTLKYYASNPEAYREKCLSIQEAAKKSDWSNYIDDWIEFFKDSCQF